MGSLINQLVKIFLSFLLIFILPILLVLLIAPMHLCRFCVKILAKILRPDLTSIVSCSSNTTANLSNTLENPRLAIITKATYHGRIELEEFREICSKKIIDLKNPQGDLEYPEYRQALTSFMGFRFWTQDKNFDIKNHINLYEFENKSKLTLDDLKDLEKKLMVQSFNPDRSPWRGTVVHDDSKNSTHLIYTIAHVLCDGYSVIKMNEALCDIETKEEITPSYSKRNLLEKILLPFKCVYVCAEIIVETLVPYPFKISQSSAAFVGNIQSADGICTEIIKNIKRKYNASFSSVVFSIATGALRELAIENGIKLTKSIPCMIPLPRPGHSGKPSNHFVVAALNLPIAESDPVKRLKLCDQEFKRIKSSAYPLVSYLSIILTGGCFNFIGKIIGNPDPAVSMSYLPVPWSKCTLAGHEMLGLTFCYAQAGTVGCSIQILSALDNLTMFIVAEGSVLSKEQVSKFPEIIRDQVNVFMDCSDQC